VESDNGNILFPVLLTVPLLALLWVIATRTPAPPSPVTAGPAAQRALYRTTAAELYRDYNHDAVGTQQRIGARRIVVTGVVVDVSKDYLGQNLVLLDAGNGISTADMTLIPDRNALAVELQRGQQVSLVCDQMQRYSDSPTGTDCSLAAPRVAAQSSAPSESSPIEPLQPTATPAAPSPLLR
jgi:hypothetical protein